MATKGTNDGVVSILMELVDKASPELSKFKQNFERASQAVSRDADRMGRDTEGGVGRIAASFSRLAPVIAGVSAAFVAVGRAISYAVETSARINEMANLGSQFGYTATQMSAVDTALKAIGGSAEDVTGFINDVAGAMVDAQEAGSDAALAFQRLGIAVTDANGNFRSAQDVAVEVAQKIAQALDNQTMSAQQMVDFQKIAGEQFVKDSKSVLEFADALKMANEAYADGIGWSERATKVSGEYATATQRLKLAFEDMGGRLAEIVLPLLTNLIEMLYNSYTNSGLLSEAFKALQLVMAAVGAAVRVVTIGLVFLDASFSAVSRTVYLLAQSLDVLLTAPWGSKMQGFKNAWTAYTNDIVKIATDANKRITAAATEPLLPSGKPETPKTGAGAASAAAADLAKRQKEEAKAAADQKKAADDFVVSLRKQNGEMGKSTAEKLRLQAATLNLTDGQKKEVESLIGSIDAKDKKTQADKRGVQASNQLVNKYNETIAKLKEEMAGYSNLTGVAKLRYTIENSELSKLTPARKQHLLSLQEEIDKRTRLGQLADTQYEETLRQEGIVNTQKWNTASMEAYYALLSSMFNATTAEADASMEVFELWKDIDNVLPETLNKFKVMGALVKQMEADKAAGRRVDEGTLAKYKEQLAVLQQQLDLYNSPEWKAATQKRRDELRDQVNRQTELNTKIDDFKKLVSDPARELAAIERQREALDDFYARNLISYAQYKAEKTKLDEREFTALAGQLSDLEKNMVKVAKGFEESMSTFFFDIMQGKISDLASSFKKVLDRMFADYLASQLAQVVFGGATAENVARVGMKAAGGGGLAGQAMDWLTTNIKPLFRAQGGPVTSGSPYIVGEVGPEMFIPKSSGTIIPADVTAAMSSGATNNLTVNITAMDSQSVLGAMDKIKRPLAEMMAGTARTYNLGAR